MLIIPPASTVCMQKKYTNMSYNLLLKGGHSKWIAYAILWVSKIFVIGFS